MRFSCAFKINQTLFFFPFLWKSPTITKVRPLSMSWTCSKCTFINSSSQSSVCEICLSAQASPSSSLSFSPTKPKWACKACTFLNQYDNSNCEICGTRNSASLLSALGNDDLEELGSSVGDVFFPLKACSSNKNKRKVMGSPEVGNGKDDDQPDTSTGFSGFKSKKMEPLSVGMFFYIPCYVFGDYYFYIFWSSVLSIRDEIAFFCIVGRKDDFLHP